MEFVFQFPLTAHQYPLDHDDSTNNVNQVKIFHREILTQVLAKDLYIDERPPSICEFYESEVVKERV